MTASHASSGTPTSATGSATAPAPAFPATVNAGQKAILFVNMKPFSATCATPSGWTDLGSNTNGSTASGTNTGSVRGHVFERDCDGTEDGTTVTLAVTGADSAGAVIHLADTSLGSWDTTVVAWGNKVGNSANMSATTGTQTSVAAGDLIYECFAQNASLGTPSADTLTQTGVTYGTVTNRSDRAITTGNDSRNRVNSVPVTSVTTPSGGATGGYTNASSTSGTMATVRLRDIGGAYNGTSALAATDTVTGAGFVGTVAAATIAATVAIAAAGVVGTSTGSTVNETATITAAGNVGTAASSTIAATGTITAAGSVTSGLGSGATVAATDTITAAGFVGKATGSSITATDTITGAGQVGKVTSTAISETAAIAAAGFVGRSSSTSLAATGAIAAAGQVATSAAASLQSVVTITAAGQVNSSSAAAIAATGTITAAGTVSGAQVHHPAHPDRLTLVTAETRHTTIPADSRVSVVPAETRTYIVRNELRHFTVPDDHHVGG